jgi:hypothetical protein
MTVQIDHVIYVTQEFVTDNVAESGSRGAGYEETDAVG